jgi:hypothetical protein
VCYDVLREGDSEIFNRRLHLWSQIAHEK